MTDSKDNHPNTEWESLSIQDRIKAMKNNLDGDSDHGDTGGLGPSSRGAPTSAYDQKNPNFEDTTAAPESAETSSEQSRRSSVVDMWRKREGGAPADLATAGTTSRTTAQRSPGAPPSSPGQSWRQNPARRHTSQQEKESAYSFEEKKESTPDCDPSWDHRQSEEKDLQSDGKILFKDGKSASDQSQDDPNLRQKNLPPLPAASPARGSTAASGTSLPNHNVVDLTAFGSEDGSVGGQPEDPVGAADSTSSQSPGRSARNIWQQRESMNRDNLYNGSGSRSSVVSASNSWKGSVNGPTRGRGSSSWLHESGARSYSPASTGEKSTTQPPRPGVDASPVSPAFNDVRAKWAQFGANKAPTRGDTQRRSSPRWSPKSKDGNEASYAQGNSNSRPVQPVLDTNKEKSDQWIKREGNGHGEPKQSATTPTRREVLSRRHRRFGSDHSRTSLGDVSTEAENGKRPESASDVGGEPTSNPGTPSRKKDLLVKMGQMHTARPKSMHDSGPRTPDSRGGRLEGDKIPQDQRGGLDKPPKNSPNIRSFKKSNVQSRYSPSSTGDSSVGTTSSSNNNKPAPIYRGLDKKQILAMHRRRMRANHQQQQQQQQQKLADESSVSSDALSQAFMDAFPEDEGRKVSQQFTGRHDKDALSRHKITNPSIPMKTMMNFGADEDPSVSRGQRSVVPESPRSEYDSLCLSDSNSFRFPDARSRSLSNRKIYDSDHAHRSTFDHDRSHRYPHTDAYGDDAQSYVSNDETFQSGMSQTSLTSPRSTNASNLASRAGKHLRDKRQKKGVSGTENGTKVAEQQRQGAGVHSRRHADASNSTRESSVTSNATSTRPIFDKKSRPSSSTERDDGRQTYISEGSTTASGHTTEAPRRAMSFNSDTTGTNSYMVSTVATESTGRAEPTTSKAIQWPSPAPGLPHTKEVVTDEFVSESNTNVEAFTSAYQSLSLEQIANDLKEEVTGSVYVKSIDFNKIATDLNEGMTAASESLNRLVGTDVFAKNPKLRIPTNRQGTPVQEEVAIEVEYIEDSEDDGGFQ